MTHTYSIDIVIRKKHFTCNTKKVKNGFKYIVASFISETGKPAHSHKVEREGILPTRARATLKGRKWKRWLSKN